MPPKKELKGILAKLLQLVGVPPTEQLVLIIRIAIVVLGLLVVLYTYLTYDTVAEKYGNYEEFKSQFPR